MFQTNEHPNPGKKFSARGFPRQCYLPDNEKGRKVCGFQTCCFGQRNASVYHNKAAQIYHSPFMWKSESKKKNQRWLRAPTTNTPCMNSLTQVLKLLITAWDRRLIFTIGTSSTTGESDTVVWNEIHHKTEFGSNLTGHGYPDPNYLDNILTELSAQGVGEDNVKD